jgi:hypothetical protein
MPFHLEYLAVNEEKLDQILAYMYHLRHFQGLFGDAGFFTGTQEWTQPPETKEY